MNLQAKSARHKRLAVKALRAASQNRQTLLGVIFNLCVTFKKRSDSSLNDD
jgi:hypothetical protein